MTYKGHLLYLFAEDQKPGQTTGEGLNNFGAKWYALTPKGAVIDRDWRARDTTAHTPTHGTIQGCQERASVPTPVHTSN